MDIVELQPAACQAWDDYVQGSLYGLPQHLSGWQDVLDNTYNYKTHFLMATEEEQVVGVMPLFTVQSLLVGGRLTTTPGGLCADNPEIADALINEAKSLAHRGGLPRLVIQDTRQEWPGNLGTSCQHVYWRVDVSMGCDELWNGLDRNIRRQVRMARKGDVRVLVTRDQSLLADYAGVMSLFTRQMGTPFFGVRFLQNVAKAFPDGYSIAVVYKGSQPVGGYFQLLMGDTVFGAWGGTLREYLPERAVYLAYWEMLQDAAQHNYHALDMGRSPANSSHSDFKGQWGGQSFPVFQQVASAATNGYEPASSMTSDIQAGGKFRLFMQTWSKLPVPVTRFLGPRLRKHVPFA